ncbi:YjjG family noncanonical pyrimidine nucleotidase [Bdellovibrio bacteriovorus]
MKYDLFLFDLDDTLLDFKASEGQSFSLALKSLGVESSAAMFELYQGENRKLWTLFEKGLTTKEHLKVERFRKIFETFAIEADPNLANERYQDALSETVVLIDYSVEICQWLSKRGEIGIITNGIHATQIRRIKNSAIAPYISFISVSEECGYAKPDVRFFEYSAKMAKDFKKNKSLVIGDRIETDIEGAHNFGVSSCWFNPGKITVESPFKPKYEISHLSELEKIVIA